MNKKIAIISSLFFTLQYKTAEPSYLLDFLTFGLTKKEDSSSNKKYKNDLLEIEITKDKVVKDETKRTFVTIIDSPNIVEVEPSESLKLQKSTKKHVENRKKEMASSLQYRTISDQENPKRKPRVSSKKRTGCQTKP